MRDVGIPRGLQRVGQATRLRAPARGEIDHELRHERRARAHRLNVKRDALVRPVGGSGAVVLRRGRVLEFLGLALGQLRKSKKKKRIKTLRTDPPKTQSRTAMTRGGKRASSATWMPKDWSQTPGRTL